MNIEIPYSNIIFILNEQMRPLRMHMRPLRMHMRPLAGGKVRDFSRRCSMLAEGSALLADDAVTQRKGL